MFQAIVDRYPTTNQIINTKTTSSIALPSTNGLTIKGLFKKCRPNAKSRNPLATFPKTIKDQIACRTAKNNPVYTPTSTGLNFIFFTPFTYSISKLKNSKLWQNLPKRHKGKEDKPPFCQFSQIKQLFLL